MATPVAATPVVIASQPTTSELQATVNQLLEQLKAIIAQLQAQGVKVPAAAEKLVALPDRFVKLARALDVGMTGDDVRELQKFLSGDKAIYPEGLVTGYYGSATKRAVMKFQAKHGIEQVGRVGPKTLKKLNELMGQ